MDLCTVLEEKKETKENSSVALDKATEHHRFMELWSEAFQPQFGVAYRFAGGKDGKAVKDLLRSTRLSAEELVHIARAAWPFVNDSTKFPCRFASTVARFNAHFTEIQLATKTTNEKTHDKPHVDRNTGTCNQDAAREYAGVGQMPKN